MITPDPLYCTRNHDELTLATCVLFIDVDGLPDFFPYCDEHRPVLRTSPPPPHTTYIEELR